VGCTIGGRETVGALGVRGELGDGVDSSRSVAPSVGGEETQGVVVA
jgi:hypothetical protein